MIIDNFKSSVFKASGLKTDHRFKSWAKFVDQVDAGQSNGYCFVGDYINGGTVELEERPRIILVASETGSMKYHSYDYAVLKMNADGSLESTGIETGGERGWALRIRSDVAALVAGLSDEQVNPLAAFDTGDLIAELTRRGVGVQS